MYIICLGHVLSHWNHKYYKEYFPHIWITREQFLSMRYLIDVLLQQIPPNSQYCRIQYDQSPWYHTCNTASKCIFYWFSTTAVAISSEFSFVSGLVLIKRKIFQSKWKLICWRFVIIKGPLGKPFIFSKCLTVINGMIVWW